MGATTTRDGLARSPAAVGAADGWRASCVLDPRRLNESQMALNIVGLAIAFFLLASALRRASNTTSSRDEGTL